MKVLNRRRNDAVVDDAVIEEWDHIVEECNDVEELRIALRSMEVVRTKLINRIRKLS